MAIKLKSWVLTLLPPVGFAETSGGCELVFSGGLGGLRFGGIPLVDGSGLEPGTALTAPTYNV
jgi:hypothetical protein